MGRYHLGVDLGTTYTCAAVARGDDAQVVQLETDAHAMPSVVALRDDGGFVVGAAAARRTVSDPTRVAREFKRRFGDVAPIVLGGQRTSPEELTRELLRETIARVVGVEGEPPVAVALTHPAAWGPFRIDKLREVAGELDLHDVTLIPEPVAAAIANADRLGADAVVAVYDLGGGTFDAAVVAVGDRRVLGSPEGVERLGGLDIDALVMNHVDDATGGMVTEADIDDADTRTGLARLAEDCRLAKESLSTDAETDIPVLLPNVRTSVRLTRSELEAMVRPRLGDSVVVLDRVVASAGLTWDGIDAVLLVGGSSRIPIVAQLVGEHTGRPVVTATNPNLAIALGAAMSAGASVATGAAPAAVASATAPATVADSEAPPRSTLPAPKRPSRVPLLAGIVGVLAIVAAVAYVAVGRGADSAPAAGPVTSIGGGSTPSATRAATGASSTSAATGTGTSAPSNATRTVAVGSEKLDVTTCTVDPAVAKASHVAIDGTIAVALVEGDPVLLAVDAAACALRLDTKRAGGKLLTTDTSYGSLSVRGTTAVASGAAGGGVIIDVTTGRAVQCTALKDTVVMNFNGKQVLTWRQGTRGYDVIEFDNQTCNLKNANVSPQIELRGLVSADGTAILGVRRTAFSVMRTDNGNVVWEQGGTGDYTSIDGVSKCGRLYCVLDASGGRLTVIDVDGKLVGRVGTDQLGSTVARRLIPDEESGWFVGQSGDGNLTLLRLHLV